MSSATGTTDVKEETEFVVAAESPTVYPLKDRMDFLLAFLTEERKNFGDERQQLNDEVLAMVSIQMDILKEELKLKAPTETSAVATLLLPVRCKLQLKRITLKEKAMELSNTVNGINETITQIKSCLRLGASKGLEDVDLVKLDIGVIQRSIVAFYVASVKQTIRLTKPEVVDDSGMEVMVERMPTMEAASRVVITNAVPSVSGRHFDDSVSATDVQTAADKCFAEASGLHCTHLIIFIHGYSETTAQVEGRTAALERSFGTKQVVVAWNWKSLGYKLRYFRDRYIALKVAPLFVDFLAAVRDTFTQIDIITHSTGSFVLIEAMKAAIKAENRAVFAKSHIMCVAADVRMDNYVNTLKGMHDTVPQWTHYYNRKDTAMFLSTIANFSLRAGNQPVEIEGSDKLHSISVVPIGESGFDFERLCQHHYIDKATFKTDMRKALVEGMPPSERGLTHLGGCHWLLRAIGSDRIYGCFFE